ncbi:MAG: universal stress protein [Planctomycetales bacterium]|nr:universal stress protein [Planctomycetales bacterium]
MKWSFDKPDIVVPYDFSDESHAAVEVALELASDASRVHVVHILPDLLSAAEPAVIWDAIDEKKRREHVLESLRERLSDLKAKDVELHVEIGSPAPHIAAVAERVGAGLIVLPSHGRTGLKRLMLGSVAEGVVRLAHCPVMVLKS